MKTKVEEWVVQKLDPRCPYCDQPIMHGESHLKIGEHRITCPSCQRAFIKVVSECPEREGTG
ncbi:MAG: hypothetical protein MUO29_04750 [Desulfobacterales bacterium]|nr:hypothetical protein [Desulfobacterales bacterium]